MEPLASSVRQLGKSIPVLGGDVMRLVIALIFALSTYAAYAQFNGCGPGFCNQQPAGAVPPTGCVGAADFSDGCAASVFGH